MKTAGQILAAICCILCCSLSGFSAAEDSFSIDVYARYMRDRGTISIPLENGSGHVAADDGNAIGVSGASDALTVLIVSSIEPNGKEAWAWMTDCLSGIGSLFQAYDLCFWDANGNCIHADGVTVSVSCPDDTEGLLVCAVAVDGTVAVLDYILRDGQILFTADGSRYYALVQSSDADVSTGSERQSEPIHPSLPVSGWIIFLWIGVLLLFFFLVKHRRRNKDESSTK